MTPKSNGPHHYLACDLGAESGRVIAGTVEDDLISLRELHRFPNAPLRSNSHLCWDFHNLEREIAAGLDQAARSGVSFASLSTDSWGVDYALFDSAGRLQPPVHHYRDPRTKAGVQTAFERTSWQKIFEETGIQFMPINTVFQLCAENPNRLRGARFLLGVGDAINYCLSGAAKIEVSMASTFQLYNPRARDWSWNLIDALRLPREIFPEIVPSGTKLGPLRNHPGLGGVEVIATCSHDTGAAVAGVPAEGGSWAYLSSGTWSLLGVEWPEPIINDAARDWNFTNEIGFGGAVRLLKNLSGLWLVQECRREWSRAGANHDYQTLVRMAAKAPAFRSLIDPGAEEFLAPPNMPEQISEFCRRTSQPVPENEGQFVRCALESLALLYGRTVRQLEKLMGRSLERLHVVGGGSQNDLLNQFTANATGLRVLAGPAEATAAGNILIQALALGHLSSLEQARAVVRRSNSIREFLPDSGAAWNLAARRFETLSHPGRSQGG